MAIVRLEQLLLYKTRGPIKDLDFKTCSCTSMTQSVRNSDIILLVINRNKRCH